MKKQETKPKVFIIETLNFEDEEKFRFEGGILSDILSLSGIETKYFYIRTAKEFKEVVSQFNKSQFRYLHISCHGGKNSVWTTLDEITYQELSIILKDKLNKKRLFLSACSPRNSPLSIGIVL